MSCWTSIRRIGPRSGYWGNSNSTIWTCQAGTVTDGLKRIEPLLTPVYEAFCRRNRQGDFHQADETRWPVFVLFEGKRGHGWWLWVVLGVDSVIYLLDPSRGHEVPEAHFGPQASGTLEVDRYSGYKAMAQVKLGLIVLAFCSAHVRRRLRRNGQELAGTDALGTSWLRRIRHLYQINRERLQHTRESAKFQEQQALLCAAVEVVRRDGGRTLRFQTPPTVPQSSGEPRRALDRADAVR